MPFSQDTVIKRTASRLGTNETKVRAMLDTYADEYVKHARETEPTLIAPPAQAETQDKTAKGAKSRKSAGKSAPKGEQTTVIETAESGQMEAPDGTPPPPSEAPRVTADDEATAEAEAVGNPT